MITITQPEENSGTKELSDSMRVLVANEPLAYREVISAVVKELRPCIEIHTADPADLDKELSQLGPWLVICSQTTARIEREAPAWVELYPKHTSRAIVSLPQERIEFEEMRFDTLLSILDKAQRLYQSV